jgi:hypothetical protein
MDICLSLFCLRRADAPSKESNSLRLRKWSETNVSRVPCAPSASNRRRRYKIIPSGFSAVCKMFFLLLRKSVTCLAHRILLGSLTGRMSREECKLWNFPLRNFVQSLDTSSVPHTNAMYFKLATVFSAFARIVWKWRTLVLLLRYEQWLCRLKRNVYSSFMKFIITPHIIQATQFVLVLSAGIYTMICYYFYVHFSLLTTSQFILSMRDLCMMPYHTSASLALKMAIAMYTETLEKLNF